MANNNPNSIFGGTNPNQLLPNSFGPNETAPLAKVINLDSNQPPPQLQRVDFGGTPDPLYSTVPDRPQGEIPRVTFAPPPEQQHIESLRADRQRLSDADARPYGFAGAPASAAHPKGLAPNHPGTWGKIAHVLSVAGNIAGDIVAPNVMANVPGTEINRRMQERGDTNEINHEQQLMSENQGRDASTAATLAATAAEPQKLKGELALQDAQTAEANARAGTLQSPSLATAYAHAVQDALKNGRDPSQDPVVQHLSDAITSIQKQPAEQGVGKTTDIKGPDGKVHTMGYDQKTGKFDIDEGQSGFKPQVVNVNAGIAGLDRETKQFGTPQQKSIDAVNAQLEKIADARSMINGNAEAQGLGIPKVLTALVGGQGTGVRITQAELQSIAHARGLQGDVEGTLNKLAGKGALSHEQQQQLTQIMDDVKARLLQKQAIASGALDNINGASTREQIIQADKDARKKLSDLETGAQAPTASSGGVGVIRARDPHGNIHTAPAGTKLPQGWQRLQ